MPANRLERSLKATFIGMAVNASLTAAKFAGGFIGHSHALIADAVESSADILSSIIVWRGIVVAAEPADREHPYGHGKAEPMAAAVVAIVLLFAALGIIIKAAVDLAGQRAHAPRLIALLVLLVVIATKELLFRYISRQARAVESIVVKTDAWHHRSDAISSLAAAIGISLALLGGKFFAFADDAAAIIAGLIIGFNGWRLLRPAADELMDVAPNSAMIAQIRSTAAGVEGVAAVEKCIVRKAGFQYFVDMHVEVDPRMTVRQAHEIAHAVKDKVRQAIPSVHDVLVHIEPHSR